MKLEVENGNVVPTLPNFVHINGETHNIDSTLFDIDLTLLHVETSYQLKDNVEATLKVWCEATLISIIALNVEK